MTSRVAVGPAGMLSEAVVIGGPGTSTVKSTPGLNALPTCTVTGPLVAPGGTGAVIEVGAAAVTVPGTRLKSTVFPARTALKPVPSSTTGAPTGAAGGLSAVTASDGAACTWNTEKPPA